MYEMVLYYFLGEYSLHRRLDGSQGWSRPSGEEKNLLPMLEIKA
jgi:hypothetical protein